MGVDGSSAGAPALSLRGLTKVYGAKTAVDHLDLTVRPGELYALLGPNGAGKTTTLRMAVGLLKPDGGAISIFGVDALADAAGAKRLTAWLPDEPMLYDKLTPLEYLDFVAGLWSVPGKVAKTRAEDLLKTFDLWDQRGQRCEGFSRGMKQKTALAGALIHDPKLLILDEPLTGLDARRKDEILPYLERLRDEMRLPMLFVSHDVEEVVRLADRLVLLDRGRVTASGPIDEVMGRLDLSGEGGAGEAGTVLSTEIVAIDRAEGLATAVFPGGRLILPAGGLSEGDRPRLHIRARDVAIATERPSGISILNVLPAMVEALQAPQDGMVDVRLSLGPARLVARITRRSAETLGLFPGKNVHALIKSVAFDRGRRSLG